MVITCRKGLGESMGIGVKNRVQKCTDAQPLETEGKKTLPQKGMDNEGDRED